MSSFFTLFPSINPTKAVAAQILAGCLLLGGAGIASAADFYLSPDGDDAHPGTQAEPFASLERARQAVRTVNGAMTGDIVVQLAPGDYPTTSPVIFGAEDSGMNGHRVIYRAAGAPGSARLIGGMQVTNWEPYNGAIMRAQIGASEFHTLYENGRRAHKARTPNRVATPDLPMAHAPYLRATGSNGSYTNLQYRAGSLDPAGWDLSGAQIYIWPGGRWAWFTDTIPITSVNPATRTFTLAHEARYPIYNSGTGSRFYVQGVLELLDAPGEFHYDAASGYLYYWPMDGPAGEQEIVVPMVRRILSLEGGSAADPVRNLSFEGLGIEFTDFTGWYRHAHVRSGESGESHTYPIYDRQATLPQHREGAVFLTNAQSIHLDSCVIRNVGYSGVASFFANRDHLIERCWISRTGLHGVFFEGNYPGEGDVQFDNKVDNCLIHDVGELAGQAAGVQLSNVSRHEISRSVIYNSTRYAVSLNAYLDIPRADIYTYGNDFHHLRIDSCTQDSGDTAPVYTFGLSDDAPFLRNDFRQLIIDRSFAHPSMSDAAPNAIFLDNDSHGQHFTHIDARDSQGALYRVNDSSDHVLTNVSWRPSFDPSLMDYDSIGVAADHPFPVRPIRLEATSLADRTQLDWLPVANATSYTVESAPTGSGPWEVLATGLTSATYDDTRVLTSAVFYRVRSIGPLATTSEPSLALSVPPRNVINFETSQGYTQGTPISTINGSISDAPYDGVNGWSRSISDDTGVPVPVNASGEYPGGLALTTSSSLKTYIGGIRDGVFPGESHQLIFDAQCASNQTVAVGFMADGNANGLFDQLLDTGMNFGMSGTQVRYREARFGAQTLAAANLVAGHWYRFEVTVSPVSSGERSLEIAVRNLTTGVDLDFDAGIVGQQPWSVTVSESAFGPAPEVADGLYVRVTGNNAKLDNLLATVRYPSAFDTWIEGFTSLTGDQRLPDADPDLDGLTNLLEWVLGGTPDQPDGALLTLVPPPPASDHLVFRFSRRDETEAEVELVVQWSTDLSADSWSEVSLGAQSGEQMGITWDIQENGEDPDTITVSLPPGGSLKLFARIKVSQTP